MRYPKPFDAGPPAGPCYVASRRNGDLANLIEVGTYVNRPGTPDHTRLVRTRLALADAIKLRDELSAHITLLQERTSTNG